MDPTAQEAAIARIIAIGEEIHKLQKELEECRDREWKYRGSNVLESERIAAEQK